MPGAPAVSWPLFAADAKLTHALDQNNIAANETPTGGYTRLDAGITCCFQLAPSP